MVNNKKNLLVLVIVISLMSLALVLLSSYLPTSTFYTLLGVMIFSIFFAKIEIGIYSIAFFLPVINWNINYASLEIPLIDLIAILVLFVLILQKFLARNFSDIKFIHILSFATFFISTIISSIFSDNIFSSVWYSIRWILFFYLMYIVLPFSVIKNEKILRNTLGAFVLSALVISVMGLFSILTQDWLNTLARVRPISFFGMYPIGENQNLIVETLLPALFYLIALKYWMKSELSKKISNVLIGLISFILILTFSRGAWLSLSLVSILSAIVYFRKDVYKFLTPLLFIFIIITPLIFYMINLQTTYSVGVSSNKSRLLLTDIAWDGFRRSPIVGQGTGEYLSIVAENIRFRANYGEPVDSHGFLQKILLENGALGIVTFSFFVLAIFKKLLSVFKDRKYIELYLPMTAAVFSIFIFELFNTSYYKGKLWFVVALALVTVKLIEEKKIYEK